MNQLIACLTLAGALSVTITSLARADDNGCCGHCGCQEPCQQICRLVEEEKTIEIVCWGIKCEDFCVPGKSERGCKNCETVCDTCGNKGSEDICVEPKRFVWYDWLPGCDAKIYTRHKLMRGVTTKKVPSFKWVVEDLCADCVASYTAPVVDPGAELPPAPSVAAHVLFLGPQIK